MGGCVELSVAGVINSQASFLRSEWFEESKFRPIGMGTSCSTRPLDQPRGGIGAFVSTAFRRPNV